MLHRYAGEDDILVGMPTLGRPESRFDGGVGYCVNMLASRSRIRGQQEVGAFLKNLQLTVADALDNADYPFPALLKTLQIERDPARSPLFQVMFAYQNFIQPHGAGDAAQMPLPIEVLPGISQEGSHDLELEVYGEANSFRLKFDHNVDLFAPDTIRRAMEHYLRLQIGRAHV